MNHSILLENQKRRLERSTWLLICFAMFCFWQMGFVYFMGPALTINGRTPLPISMDNIATLIAVAYVCSITWMIFLPHYVVWAQRVSVIIALLSVVGLFLPLPDAVWEMLIYIQAFCCCFMIGFETFVISNLLSEKSAIQHLTIAYGVSFALIAAVQNDFSPITFPIFRFVTIIALVLLLYFVFKLPTSKDACPIYVKKENNITAPKKLMIGMFILVFVCALMGVSGPSISEEVKNGVCIAYLVDAIVSFILYMLYKKYGIHPFRLMTVCIGIGAMGFLLMFTAVYVPFLAYIGCILIGFGMVSCQMLPLYNLVVMKSYPSKYIAPTTIGLALVAVLVQSGIVEVFRTTPTMLYLIYAIIMVALVVIYLQIEPFFLCTLNRKTEEKEQERKEELLDILTKREKEVVELITYGYSNGDIAKMLFISEHTVKDHTKNIYRKMEVHSRFELAAKVNRIMNKVNE